MTATEEDRLLKVEQELSRLCGLLEGRELRCVDHARRLERVEVAVGRSNLVASVIGAVSAGVVLAAKALFARGG